MDLVGWQDSRVLGMLISLKSTYSSKSIFFKLSAIIHHPLPYFKLCQAWFWNNCRFHQWPGIPQWPGTLSSQISFPFPQEIRIRTCQNPCDTFLHFKLNFLLFSSNFINDNKVCTSESSLHSIHLKFLSSSQPNA